MSRVPKIEQSTWKFAPTKMPSLPSELTGEAKAEWDRLEPHIVAISHVAEIDKQSVAAYCLSWQNFARLIQELPPGQALYEDGPSCEVAHPAIPPLLRYARNTIEMAGLFGITARTRELEGSHGNRKSSTLKRYEGNLRKVAECKLGRSVVPMLPEWEPTDVRCPDWMTPRAKAEYYELGDSLSNLDLFTPLDRTPLVIGCCMYDLFLTANEQLAETGAYTTVVRRKKVDGEWEVEEYQREHPLHRVTYDIFNVLHLVWKDYGQTARYRKIFSTEKPKEREVPIIFKGKFG